MRIGLFPVFVTKNISSHRTVYASHKIWTDPVINNGVVWGLAQPFADPTRMRVAHSFRVLCGKGGWRDSRPGNAATALIAC